MINFYKNVSIFGGLLLLALTGPGKYSLDGKWRFVGESGGHDLKRANLRHDINARATLQG